MKAQRRKLLRTEEVRIYDYAQAHKYDSQKRLDEVGYRKEEEYTDCVSYLAW